MCGISGWYRRRHRPVDASTIIRQTDRLRHRGPDDSGFLVDGDFGFGMRRLSIIDVAGGHQPIDSPDGRYSIVCNGEIVNHPELRRLLEPHYPFSTRSDIETLLAAFLTWGDSAWLKLEGMYAAAIWDRRERLLRLVRDPVGIKPLFVSEQDGGLGFASEIPALREIPGYEFDVDRRAADDFFRFGHVIPPRTIFRQVRSVEPGHCLTLGPTGAARLDRFWKPTIAPNRGPSEADWVEETRLRVQETVRQHLLSDVPVGAFLSGGVDSGAIASAMARSGGGPFILFTAGFPGSKIDESERARRIARHLGCEHIVLPIEPTTAADILPKVQQSFDEPSAANSAIPLWYLSRAAKASVDVVLCGEGGDELFLGYNRHVWSERMRRASPLLRKLGPKLARSLPRGRNRKLNYLGEHVRRFAEGAGLADGYERFIHAVRISSPELRARLYSRGFASEVGRSDEAAQLADEIFGVRDGSLSEIEQFEMGDLSVHLQASLLQRLDRASMAHSLEARVPFLSRGFIDWALTVPPELKLRRGVGKYVLRRAVEPWLPRGAIGTDKKGFQMPLADWFTGDFNDFAREAWFCSGASDAGFLDPAAVSTLFEEHRLGRANHGRLLYALAMFGCWWSGQRQSAASSVQPRLMEIA